MNPSQALATVLVDELVRGGVREVVLCPGSRSAPLAYAVLAAERSGRLRLHVRVDERSAGFLALGLARGSRAPVAVMTTSGTAVANLHPAVLEAHHAGIPLVVVSADRPHELRGTGANQTTAQPGIFGASTGTPSTSRRRSSVPGCGPFWRSTVCRALAAATGATGGEPGPVHLNVCLREPLAPELEPPPALVGHREPRAGRRVAGRPGGPGRRRAVGGPGRHATASTEAAALTEVARTLVFVGVTRDPALGERAVAWATERGHPVVAEPFGSAAVRAEAACPTGRCCSRRRDWLDGHLPDRVVVVGRPTLSRAVGALLRRPGLCVEVVSEGGRGRTPRTSPPPCTAPRALRLGGPDGRRMTTTAGARPGAAAARLADAVAAQPFPWPSGLGVASAVVDGLPGDAVLVARLEQPRA